MFMRERTGSCLVAAIALLFLVAAPVLAAQKVVLFENFGATW
jgi:hypothetical protein